MFYLEPCVNMIWHEEMAFTLFFTGLDALPAQPDDGSG
jgi:hypothetical protein